MTQDFHVAKRFSEGQKRALVDIDETIMFYPEGVERRYNNGVPNQENINKINKMYDEGWEIIYWTGRGGVSGKDYHEFTLKQLKEHGCKFHDLYTGTHPDFPKPHFDLVIDDKAKRIEEIESQEWSDIVANWEFENCKLLSEYDGNKGMFLEVTYHDEKSKVIVVWKACKENNNLKPGGSLLRLDYKLCSVSFTDFEEDQ